MSELEEASRKFKELADGIINNPDETTIAERRLLRDRAYYEYQLKYYEHKISEIDARLGDKIEPYEVT